MIFHNYGLQKYALDQRYTMCDMVSATGPHQRRAHTMAATCYCELSQMWWTPDSCRYKSVQCHFCRKIGHIAAVCHGCKRQQQSNHSGKGPRQQSDHLGHRQICSVNEDTLHQTLRLVSPTSQPTSPSEETGNVYSLLKVDSNHKPLMEIDRV